MAFRPIKLHAKVTRSFWLESTPREDCNTIFVAAKTILNQVMQRRLLPSKSSLVRTLSMSPALVGHLLCLWTATASSAHV